MRKTHAGAHEFRPLKFELRLCLLHSPTRSANFRFNNSEDEMRLGYFTMPVHPMGRDWSQTLREDREAIILADRLGFHDAFMGEHLTDACENITNSMLFLATLIHDT